MQTISLLELGHCRDPKPKYTIAVRSRWRDEWEVRLAIDDALRERFPRTTIEAVTTPDPK